MARPRGIQKHTVMFDIAPGMGAAVGKDHRVWREVGRWLGKALGAYMAGEVDATQAFLLEFDGPKMAEASRTLGEIGLEMRKKASG